MVVATETSEPQQIKSFQNNFWNCEFGNFTGFDILVKRSKDGRIICKEYIEYMRQRALIEEQYGKSLLKLSKSSLGCEEMGGIRRIWDSLKGHTETVALAHTQASNQLELEVGKVAEFTECSRDKRRWAEDNVRSLQNQIKTAYKRTQDLRKLYETRCREEVQASHTYHQEVARGGQESGGSEKAAARHSKVRGSMESAETAYRGSVDYLEEVRNLWEKETELASQSFQDVEIRRLSLLRDSIWKLTNILSATCVSDDQVYEETRKTLEDTDLEEGIQLFINQHQTGTVRPGCQQAESLPNSSTIGMGHARQYESCSLGRSKNFSSLGHLADAGRSRSDLGFQVDGPPARPRKPPRLHTYELPSPQTVKINNNNTRIVTSKHNNNNNNNNKNNNNMVGKGHGRNGEGFSKQPAGSRNRRAPSRERHTMPICVENAEYYKLPGLTGLPPKPQTPDHKEPAYIKPHGPEYAAEPHVFPPKSSYSSDYSDTSLDSGKYSAASTPPTPSQRYFPPTSPSPGQRYRRSSSSPYCMPRPPPPSSSSAPPPPSSSSPYGAGAPPPPSCSSPYGAVASPLSASSYGAANAPPPSSSPYCTSRSTGSAANTGNLRRARVLCEYKQKGCTEITLGRNEFVWVAEGGQADEWWKVRTDAGRTGYFPQNFLRVVDSPT